MYVPPFNAMEDAEARALVAAVGSAELVTVGPTGYPEATLLPVIWDDTRLVFHLARANPQWRSITDGDPALAVVTGPQGYVSPAWYDAAAHGGRAVPTWNYSAVHFRGRLQVRHDTEWLLQAVTRLTELHERRRAQPWSLHDADDEYVRSLLPAIVGIELTIEDVEAKAKLSQNRPPQDRAGVVTGLRREGGGREHDLARTMTTREPGSG